MDESLKRRLVGATVLVSLIVIFVPMLLEDQSRSPPAIEGSNIPPRSDNDSGLISSPVIPLEDEPLSVPSAVPDLPEPELADPRPSLVITEQPDLPEPEPRFGAPEPISEPPVPGMPEPEEAEPQGPVAPATREPAEPAPIKPAAKRLEQAAAVEPARPPSAVVRPEVGSTKTEIKAWVVQVGSFSQRSNADKLVQDLRAARYPAFQERTQVKGKTLYRVRVGPEADRELADAMAAGIAKRFKLNGRVVSYP